MSCKYAVIENDICSCICEPIVFDSIYEEMMNWTGNDREISQNAANWCESATSGEVYEFKEGLIKIEEY